MKIQGTLIDNNNNIIIIIVGTSPIMTMPVHCIGAKIKGVVFCIKVARNCPKKTVQSHTVITLYFKDATVTSMLRQYALEYTTSTSYLDSIKLVLLLLLFIVVYCC